MCGRFTQHWTRSKWDGLWPVAWRVEDVPVRYNVTPGTPVLVLANSRRDETSAGLIVWGLRSAKGLLINARAETLRERPSFRPLLDTGRAVVPMNGYYEWHHSTRQPYYIQAETPLFALALFRRQDRTAELVIVTRPASAEVREIHDRMPALASKAQAETWLSRQRGQFSEVLNRLVVEAPALVARPVAKTVNRPHAEGPELVQFLPENGD